MKKIVLPFHWMFAVRVLVSVVLIVIVAVVIVFDSIVVVVAVVAAFFEVQFKNAVGFCFLIFCVLLVEPFIILS